MIRNSIFRLRTPAVRLLTSERIRAHDASDPFRFIGSNTVGAMSLFSSYTKTFHQLVLLRHFSKEGVHVNGQGSVDHQPITEDKGEVSPHDKFTHEVKVCMPFLDEGDEVKGVIEKWHKKEGDIIRRDDVICDISTEVFTFGMVTEDDFDSVMGKILVQEKSEPVKPGTTICTTFNEGHSDDK